MLSRYIRRREVAQGNEQLALSGKLAGAPEKTADAGPQGEIR
jgi:hypothetical protein